MSVTCIRCESIESIESHHIKAKADGGGDELENREPRCLACHDYEHSRRNILATLVRERKRKWWQLNRITVLEHRLEVLEKLNTPELIRERGHYQTYWIDESTHDYPRYERTKKPHTGQGRVI